MVPDYIPGQIGHRPGVKLNENHFIYKENDVPGKSTGLPIDAYTKDGQRIPNFYIREKRR